MTPAALIRAHHVRPPRAQGGSDGTRVCRDTWQLYLSKPPPFTLEAFIAEVNDAAVRANKNSKLLKLFRKQGLELSDLRLMDEEAVKALVSEVVEVIRSWTRTRLLP